ncbi:hypothetical protein Sste5346_001494, partial [Sporothrix stenoceras]
GKTWVDRKARQRRAAAATNSHFDLYSDNPSKDAFELSGGDVAALVAGGYHDIPESTPLLLKL